MSEANVIGVQGFIKPLDASYAFMSYFFASAVSFVWMNPTSTLSPYAASSYKP